MKLRPYQNTGVEFIVNRGGRVILGDEAGLGKTATTLTSLYKLGHGKTLIICIKPGLYVWQDELQKWFGEDSIIYSGNPEERQERWERFKNENIDWLITNYYFIDEIRERQPVWDSLVTDEFHIVGLLNRKSKTFKSFKKLAKHSGNRNLVMATGTPIRSNLAELYAPLHLINPNEFTSYWQFVNKYCIKIQGTFGIEIDIRPKDVDKFISMRDKYLIRRLKDKVLKDLPPKTRQPIMVEMVPEQKKIYDKLAEDMLAYYDDTVLFAQNEMVKLLRLRQLLVTPKLLGIDIWGGALETLVELVESEFDEKHPVIIFTPFRKAIPIIEEYLRMKFKDIEVYYLHGGLTDKQTHDNEKGFQKSRTHKKVVLATIKSGMAVTLHSAKTAMFVGQEFKAYANSQAEDRCLIGNSDILCVNSNDNKITKIKNVKIGDRVITHKGNIKKVVDIYNREQRGLMTSINYVGWYEPLVCTHDHKILIKRNNEIIWIKAHKVLPSDSVAFPIPNKNEQTLYIINIKDKWRLYDNISKPKFCMQDNCGNKVYARNLCKFHYRELLKEKDRPPKPMQINPRYKRLPDIIHIDDDWLYIFGFFVAEGFSRIIGEKPKCISFSAHKKELFILKMIEDKFKSIGLNASYDFKKRVQCIEMRVYSGELALMFRDFFGHGASNKTLPDFIMNLPLGQAKVFLEGYIDGDGYRRNNSVEWVTASKTLCYQICLLVIKSGFIPNMRKVIHPKSKSIHWVGSYSTSKPNNRLFERNEDYIFRPIREVKTYYDKIKVYDLTVEEDHSYTTGLISVHNCHRLGQKDNVRVLYLLHKGTAEERVKELINTSQRAMNWTFNPKEYIAEVDKKYGKLI